MFLLLLFGHVCFECCILLAFCICVDSGVYDDHGVFILSELWYYASDLELYIWFASDEGVNTCEVVTVKHWIYTQCIYRLYVCPKGCPDVLSQSRIVGRTFQPYVSTLLPIVNGEIWKERWYFMKNQ